MPKKKKVVSFQWQHKLLVSAEPKKKVTSQPPAFQFINITESPVVHDREFGRTVRSHVMRRFRQETQKARTKGKGRIPISRQSNPHGENNKILRPYYGFPIWRSEYGDPATILEQYVQLLGSRLPRTSLESSRWDQLNSLPVIVTPEVNMLLDFSKFILIRTGVSLLIMC